MLFEIKYLGLDSDLLQIPSAIFKSTTSCTHKRGIGDDKAVLRILFEETLRYLKNRTELKYVASGRAILLLLIWQSWHFGLLC